MSFVSEGITDLAANTVLPFGNGRQHLLAEFERLRLWLQREVLRLRGAGLLTEDQFRGLYISDEQVDAVLRDHYSRRARDSGANGFPPMLSELDRQIQAAGNEILARIEASAESAVPLPLLNLAEAFSLSDFECAALIVCLAVEVDLRFETLYSYAQNDVTRKRPTPDLILRLFCRSSEESLERRETFSAEGTLFREALVRFADNGQDREQPFLARPLRAEERVVEFLLEQSRLDSRLDGFVSCRKFERPLSDLRLPVPLRTDLKNARRLGSSRGNIFHFHGPNGVGKKTAAGALAAERGRPLLVADLRRALASELPLALTMMLLHREAMLNGADLYLDHADALSSGEPARLQQQMVFLQSLRASNYFVFVGAESAWLSPEVQNGHATLTFDFPVPNFSDRTVLWEQAVREGNGDPGNVDAAALANKFVLTAGEIYSACAQATCRASLRGINEVPLAALEAAARSESNQSLRRLAQKVDGSSDWSDLVLAPRGLRQLKEICATQRHRQLVYSGWGFDRRLSLGKGLGVLFHGPSGTGKTMAAGILAREFGLDLYKIDLSTVVSKYIGETEKQLNRIFHEAQSSNAILFFDEADALFGKRSEVKDAHDRYANIEVAYLLQKMEDYDGIVILATNFRKNLDEAFTRRLRHIVEFPFPDAENRERIWRNMIPADAPLAGDVNFGFLARQFEFAGGNIRNVVLAAAFLAAEDSKPIGMEHFVLATARELQKIGRLPVRSDFREYHELMRERE